MTHTCNFLYEDTIGRYLHLLNLSYVQTNEVKMVLTEKYNRTLDILLFMQKPDIPFCCENITEFTGYPQNEDGLYEISIHYMY